MSGRPGEIKRAMELIYNKQAKQVVEKARMMMKMKKKKNGNEEVVQGQGTNSKCECVARKM